MVCRELGLDEVFIYCCLFFFGKKGCEDVVCGEGRFVN